MLPFFFFLFCVVVKQTSLLAVVLSDSPKQYYGVLPVQQFHCTYTLSSITLRCMIMLKSLRPAYLTSLHCLS